MRRIIATILIFMSILLAGIIIHKDYNYVNNLSAGLENKIDDLKSAITVNAEIFNALLRYSKVAENKKYGVAYNNIQSDHAKNNLILENQLNLLQKIRDDNWKNFSNRILTYLILIVFFYLFIVLLYTAEKSKKTKKTKKVKE
jgi:hypothetical protein